MAIEHNNCSVLNLRIYTCRPTEKTTLPAAKYDAQEFFKLVKKIAPVSIMALLMTS